jgi:hypothetical protein
MDFRKSALAAALATSLMAAPLLAQASSVARSAPALAETNSEMSDTTVYAIGGVVVAAVALAFLLAVENDEDAATSP